MSPRPMGATSRTSSYSSPRAHYYQNSGSSSSSPSVSTFSSSSSSAPHYKSSSIGNNDANPNGTPTNTTGAPYHHRRAGSFGSGNGGFRGSYTPSEPHAMVNYPKNPSAARESGVPPSSSTSSPLRPRALDRNGGTSLSSSSAFPPPPSSVDKRLGYPYPQNHHHQHRRVISSSSPASSGSEPLLTRGPTRSALVRSDDDSPVLQGRPVKEGSGASGHRGALQFVPALEEANKTRTTTTTAAAAAARPTSTSSRRVQHGRSRSLEGPPPPWAPSAFDGAGTSWDDIAAPTTTAEQEEVPPPTLSTSSSSHSCMPIRKGWVAANAHSTTSSSASSSSASPRHGVVASGRMTRNAKPTPEARDSNGEDAPMRRTGSSGNGSGGGGRISARITSLFGGRASVVGKGDATSPKPTDATSGQGRAKTIGAGVLPPSPSSASSAPVPPPSPSYSSSSSGYVGWPGTQDKRGATVAVPTSSYEESSVGVGTQQGSNNHNHHNTGISSGASVASSTLAPPTAGRRRSYETDLQAAAVREMERGWDAPNVVPPEPTPPRPDPTGANRGSPLRNSLSSMRYSRSGHSPDAARQPTRFDQQASEPNSLNFHNLFPNRNFSTSGDNAWEVGSNPSTTGYSKTSSAYFPAEDADTELSFPDLAVARENRSSSYESKHPYGSRKRPEGIVRRVSDDGSPTLPTAEALAANDHFSPPHRTFVGSAGFRGLMEKTKEVPSLMDAVDSESNASSVSKATSVPASAFAQPANHPPVTRNYKSSDRSVVESDVFDGISLSKESDVFDNLSNLTGRSSSVASPRKSLAMSRGRVSYPERIAEEGDEEHQGGGGGDDIKLVVLPGGLATIQTTHTGFSNRKTASDYDENLTNSDVDQYGFAKTPGFNQMLSAGTSRDSSLLGIDGNIGKNPRRRFVEPEDVTTSESGSSLFSDPYRFDDDHLSIDGDLSSYYIPAASMKKVLRKYRKMSDCIHEDVSLEQFERDEDEHRAFALFEMRSRIMEKDIERGLERRGGTMPVDDLVTTAYYRTAYRIRDAVIVSKAWRDGASPKDVVNSAVLTRRAEQTYYIRRPGRPDTSMFSDNLSHISGISISSQRSYWWEPVSWLDDTDFALYRCPSLGPRNMRGAEMFTIGDCQSMLLKLTNEQCINLRRELNAATKKQIEAEYQLSDDRDASDSMMTVAEMEYLGAMEEVKEISKKLVCAEQAFALVKDRIQRLVARYEQLLSKIDTESFAGASSVVTYESSYYSDVDSDVWEEREKAIWARRAQRAEVKAELAAREALLAKQEVRMIQAEKQRELEALQQKLLELQSESSFHGAVDREHSTTLAKSVAMHRHDSPTPSHQPQQQPRHNQASSPQPGSGGSNDRQKIDDVKKRFRDRMAARKQVGGGMQHPTAVPGAAPGWFGHLSDGNPGYSHSSSSPKQMPSSGRHVAAAQPQPTASSLLFRSAGEEMYQQLDFYERSLKAVERDAFFAP